MNKAAGIASPTNRQNRNSTACKQPKAEMTEEEVAMLPEIESQAYAVVRAGMEKLAERAFICVLSDFRISVGGVSKMNKNAKKRENICTIQKKIVILREFCNRLYNKTAETTVFTGFYKAREKIIKIINNYNNGRKQRFDSE